MAVDSRNGLRAAPSRGRKAKNAATAAITLMTKAARNDARQPKRSPISPEPTEPSNCPVTAANSTRASATCRSS